MACVLSVLLVDSCVARCKVAYGSCVRFYGIHKQLFKPMLSAPDSNWLRKIHIAVKHYETTAAKKQESRGIS
jgi:hypothetical protein